MDKPKEKRTWTICYADGYEEKCVGTIAEAEAVAEEHCVLHLNDYIIA